MENKTNYNEPAFPQSEPYTSQEGMTLLDYFAAKAMQAVIKLNPDVAESDIALFSYTYAEQMLEERKKYIGVKATDPANGYPSYDSFDHLTGNETETNP